MLQWRPGSAREVLWNAREGDAFVCRVLDVDSGRSRTLPRAVYSLSPDGKTAVCADFRRIQDMRPGYGYAGLPDPNAGVLAPDDVGIWAQDMDTGASELIVSVAQIAALPYPHGDLSAAKHYFNHLLFSPDGTRFIFLHRWRFGDGPFHTRMLTAALDGTDVRVVDDYGKTSHFIWRDPARILAWSWHPSAENAFYLYGDGDGQVEPVGQGAMRVNGHCTYLPGGRWVLNDTYPLGEARTQELYLYDVASDRRVELGARRRRPSIPTSGAATCTRAPTAPARRSWSIRRTPAVGRCTCSTYRRSFRQPYHRQETLCRSLAVHSTPIRACPDWSIRWSAPSTHRVRATIRPRLLRSRTAG